MKRNPMIDIDWSSLHQQVEALKGLVENRTALLRQYRRLHDHLQGMAARGELEHMNPGSRKELVKTLARIAGYDTGKPAKKVLGNQDGRANKG